MLFDASIFVFIPIVITHTTAWHMQDNQFIMFLSWVSNICVETGGRYECAPLAFYSGTKNSAPLLCGPSEK